MEKDILRKQPSDLDERHEALSTPSGPIRRQRAKRSSSSLSMSSERLPHLNCPYPATPRSHLKRSRSRLDEDSPILSRRTRRTRILETWKPEDWIRLSEYYEAAERDPKKAAEQFYLREALQKDKEDGETVELWPLDVIEDRVECIDLLVRGSDGRTVAQLVKEYESARARGSNSNSRTSSRTK